MSSTYPKSHKPILFLLHARMVLHCHLVVKTVPDVLWNEMSLCSRICEAVKIGKGTSKNREFQGTKMTLNSTEPKLTRKSICEVKVMKLPHMCTQNKIFVASYY